MRVPEGYFKSFQERMAASLPVNEAAEHPVVTQKERRTWWQQARPYIYMAAMFAGVWCMTKMFSLMRDNSDPYSIENNPTLTAALTNNDFIDDYVYGAMSEYDIMNQLYEEGIDLN